MASVLRQLEGDIEQKTLLNLLDMTRLATGQLRLKREWVPLEELPALAPSFVQHCNCGRVHPIDEVRVCGGGDALQRSAAEPT